MKTYIKEGLMRLRFHLGLGRSRTTTLKEVDMAFNRCVPYKNRLMADLAARSLKRSGFRKVLNQALQYCSMPRLGQVWTAAWQLPHSDYGVNPQWVQSELEVLATHVTSKSQVSISYVAPRFS